MSAEVVIRLMLAFSASTAFSQGLQFEVASVRLIEFSQRCPPSNDGGPGTARPTRLNYACAPLARLIADAFDVPAYRMSGFDRLGEKIVTVSAILPEGTTKDQLRIMLQNLLAARFQLKVHHEIREGNAYELTVEPSGHKLRENANPAPAGPDVPLLVNAQPLGKWDGYNMPELVNNIPGTVRYFMSPGKERAKGYAAPLSELTKILEPNLKGPITDHTGLTGRYDFDLDFEGPEYKVVRADGTILQTTAEEFFPSIPSALSKQLGLHLERKKPSVDFLVLDSIADKPTEN